MPGAHNLHDIKEQRSSRLIFHSMLFAGLRKRLTWESATKHIMRGDALPDLFNRESGVFFVDVSSREQPNVLRKACLLPEVCFVNETTIGIHFARENTLALMGTKLCQRSMEAADAGKKIYELNGFHVGSLAA